MRLSLAFPLAELRSGPDRKCGLHERLNLHGQRHEPITTPIEAMNSPMLPKSSIVMSMALNVQTSAAHSSGGLLRMQKGGHSICSTASGC
jgi:hypothetical protein